VVSALIYAATSGIRSHLCRYQWNPLPFMQLQALQLRRSNVRVHVPNLTYAVDPVPDKNLTKKK
jgi:hypothetical protein